LANKDKDYTRAIVEKAVIEEKAKNLLSFPFEWKTENSILTKHSLFITGLERNRVTFHKTYWMMPGRNMVKRVYQYPWRVYRTPFAELHQIDLVKFIPYIIESNKRYDAVWFDFCDALDIFMRYTIRQLWLKQHIKKVLAITSWLYSSWSYRTAAVLNLMPKDNAEIVESFKYGHMGFTLYKRRNK
jgi:hypothetical protein